MLSQTSTASQTSTDRWKLAWLLLAVFYLLFGFLYSVIQPPTALPDEGANMQYVQYLGTQGHLPVWEPSGQGAGGYETQHPPLAYTLQALVWRGAGGLPDNDPVARRPLVHGPAGPVPPAGHGPAGPSPLPRQPS